MSWSSKYLGEVLKWQVLQKPNQEQQSATHFVKMSFVFPLVNLKAYMDSLGPWTTFPPEWITYTFLIVFLFLMLHMCVHMLIWLACTSPPPPHTCKQGGTCAKYHHLMLLPQELSSLFCELASLTGPRDEAGLAGQPTPELYCFCHQHTSSHPFFISSSFVLFVGSGDGFQILMVVQQALYQPNCFPSSQWPVFQLHYLAWLWWLRIFIRLSPSHFA